MEFLTPSHWYSPELPFSNFELQESSGQRVCFCSGYCQRVRYGYRARSEEIGRQEFSSGFKVLFQVNRFAAFIFFLTSFFLSFSTSLLMQKEKKNFFFFFYLWTFFSLSFLWILQSFLWLGRKKKCEVFFSSNTLTLKKLKIHSTTYICLKFTGTYTLGDKSVCLPFFISQAYARPY